MNYMRNAVETSRRPRPKIFDRLHPTRPPATHLLACYFGIHGLLTAIRVVFGYAAWESLPDRSLSTLAGLILAVIVAFSCWYGALLIWNRKINGLGWIAMAIAIHAVDMIRAPWVRTSQAVGLGMLTLGLIFSWLELKDETVQRIRD